MITDLRKKCVPSKRKYVSVKVYNITRRKKAKTLVNYISCDCKCKFDSTSCNSDQKRNNDKCQFVCKKYHTCNSWNPNTCACENTRYLKTIVDD